LVVSKVSSVAPDGQLQEKNILKGIAVLPILPSISFKANF
jgi:hypothetical protein